MLLGLGWVLLATAALLLYILLSARIDATTASEFRAIAHTEKARSAWAEARNALMDLVRAGKLDVESETFRTFYGLQTFYLRRPDAYAGFSKRLAAAITHKPERAKHSWVDEVDSWPMEMKFVLDRMTMGTSLIMFGYPGGRAVMTRFLFKVLRYAAVRQSEAAWKWIADSLSKKPELVSATRFVSASEQMRNASRRLVGQPALGMT